MMLCRNLKTICFLTIISFQLLVCGTSFALSVIPGAKGFGLETSAGRGGQIIRVTNLNSSGSGSFRDAIEAFGPRIVIFEVSGNIVYNGRYKIKNPFITIAGQTAPSPGITLKGSILTVDTHDVLIQHLRVRPGDGAEGVDPEYRDSISIGLTKPPEELYNVVVDHCSASWSIDEAVEMYGCSNVTFQNCIISEPLSYSLHPKGEHSKGLIIGRNAHRISILNNLFAHSVDRNPYTSWGDNSAVIVNNLIYNPRIANVIVQCGYGPTIVSIVGNVVKDGPNTGTVAGDNMPYFKNDLYSGTRVYLSNNRTAIEQKSDIEDWSLITNNTISYSDEQVKNIYGVTTAPIWPDGYLPLPSSEVENSVLENAGARPADRDAVDIRIVNDVIHGSGRIINSPSDVGGWPNLEENKVVHTVPANPHGDNDGDGYTNVEEWLHGMAASVESLISNPEDLMIKEVQ